VDKLGVKKGPKWVSEMDQAGRKSEQEKGVD